jgi:adenine deaminase
MEERVMDRADLIDLALGKRPVDLVLKNGRLVNVFSGEIHSASVAIHKGIVVGFGEYEAVQSVDLDGAYISPGFIDGHLHIESSMLSIPEFARNVVPLGTTAVVADPHEIANVMGISGIRYMLESSEQVPLRVFIMCPSCVPATPFETSGAVLTHKDMEPFKDHDRVLGLAEMMNFPGVLMGDPDTLAKIQEFQDKVLDGHAPGLSGMGLAAYAGVGIGSDHESTALEEAREKLRAGLRVMIRQGSAAKNLDALLPVVNEHNSRNCFFVTDDLEPHDILESGHINNLVRTAIRKGVDPVRAIQMATLNTAQYFRLRRLGAILPGYAADLLVLEDLKDLKISSVYQDGVLTAENGRFVLPETPRSEAKLPGSVKVDWQKVPDFAIPAEGKSVRIIQVIPGQIVTSLVTEIAPTSDGKVVADPNRDILKVAVIERHSGKSGFSVALIRGFGLKSGALASTVAHDSHNIIVVGADDKDMLLAARETATMGGGLAVADKGAVLARLPLPIAGLMSDSSIEEVKAGLDGVVRAAHALGCELEAPFATLSFMALTPIPELKITDQGLFDSVNFRFVSLFED